MKLNEDYFENILFAEFTRNPAIAAILYQKINTKVFKNKAYQTVAEFYRMFLTEKGRLPNKTDLNKYIDNEVFALNLSEAFERSSKVRLDEVVHEEFLQEAEEFLKKRMTLLALSDVLDKYKNGHIGADEVVKKFEEVAALKLVENIGFDLYEDIEKYIAASGENSERLSTGFDKVDKYTSGGIPVDGKFLGIVSAPTNTGKSIFLGNLATNALKQGKSVLIVSLEMSEKVYATRIYSALYGMNISEVPFKHDELRDKVANRPYGRMLIKEFPPGTLTVEQLDAYIDDAKKAGYDFDLICVDYLTLMCAPGADNTNEAGKAIARKLRASSYKHACPVFTAAQINRDGFGLTPDMKFMAESIAICQESDFIISLYQNAEDSELNIMRAHILKNRLGQKDVSMKFYFNIESLRFENMDDDSEPAEADNSGITRDSGKLSESIEEALGF